MATTGYTKNFVVKNGLTTGDITLDGLTGNITSINASLTGNLSVTGNSNLGSITHLYISGGSSGQSIITDGAGNLSFANASASSSPAPMPTYVAVGDTLTIAANYQGLFGYPITVDGTMTVDGVLVDVNDSGSGSPGGVTTQLQYNNAGSFDGISTATYSSGVLTLGSNSQIKITGGTTGQVLSTDGTGNLSWTTSGGGGGGTPGGSNTQIQFNDAGSFAGNTDFTFNKTTGTLVSTIFSGSGNALSNIQGANVSGTVANATYATSAGSVATTSIVSGTSQTAVQNYRYVLANASATTLTLPSSPTLGDTVYIVVANDLLTNIVARNGQKIMSLDQDMTINSSNAAFGLLYTNSTLGWRVI